MTEDFSWQNTEPHGIVPAHEYIPGGHKMHKLLFKLGRIKPPSVRRPAPRTVHRKTRKP